MRKLRSRVRAWGAGLLRRLPRRLQLGWELGRRTVRDSRADRLPGLAAETALFTLLSLPALMLMLLGSMGYLADALGPEGRAELERLVFELPRALLTSQTYESYEQIASTIVEEGRADVISIGAVVSIWTGSRAMTRYLETITIAYDMRKSRPIWRRRTLALALTVVGMVAAIAILPALVLGPRVVQWLAPATVANATVATIDLLFWPGIALLALLALTSLFHIGVPERTPWRRHLPGAALALVLWLLASAGLRIYVAVSLQGEGVYGHLGTPIAAVLWLYVTAFAVLLGAELNVEIEKMWPHKLYPWRLRRLRRLRERVTTHPSPAENDDNR